MNTSFEIGVGSGAPEGLAAKTEVRQVAENTCIKFWPWNLTNKPSENQQQTRHPI